MQVIVNKLLVNYTDQGKGRAVVLLHGWGASLDNFAELVATLSTNHRVIAIDFPGFGGSEQPGEAWGVGEYARFVAATLEKLKVAKVFALVGHSFGGRVIIKGISDGVLQPKKVVLIGSAGVKHSDSARNLAYKSIAKGGKAILSLPGLKKLAAPAKRKLYERAGSSDYLQSGDMKETFLKTINEDLSDEAEDVLQPTLLVWGDQDQEAPLADGQYFHSVMPNSELHVVRGAGHFVHNEHPDKVTRLVEEFLA